MTNTNIYEYYLVINNQDIGEYLVTKEKDQDVRRKQKGYKIEHTVRPQVCKKKKKGGWGGGGGGREGNISACVPACTCV